MAQKQWRGDIVPICQIGEYVQELNLSHQDKIDHQSSGEIYESANY